MFKAFRLLHQPCPEFFLHLAALSPCTQQTTVQVDHCAPLLLETLDSSDRYNSLSYVWCISLTIMSTGERSLYNASESLPFQVCIRCPEWTYHIGSPAHLSQTHPWLLPGYQEQCCPEYVILPDPSLILLAIFIVDFPDLMVTPLLALWGTASHSVPQDLLYPSHLSVVHSFQLLYLLKKKKNYFLVFDFFF